jgi:hypothetical protein
MSSERPRHLCSLKVPKLQSATSGASDYGLLVRVKAHTLDGTRVPRKALQQRQGQQQKAV